MGLEELTPQQQSWLLLPSTLPPAPAAAFKSAFINTRSSSPERRWAILCNNFMSKVPENWVGNTWHVTIVSPYLPFWGLGKDSHRSQLLTKNQIHAKKNPYIRSISTSWCQHPSNTTLKALTALKERVQQETLMSDMTKMELVGLGEYKSSQPKVSPGLWCPNYLPWELYCRNNSKILKQQKKIFTAKTKEQTEQEYAQLSLLNSLQNFSRGLHKSFSFKRLLKMWILACSHETVLTLRQGEIYKYWIKL